MKIVDIRAIPLSYRCDPPYGSVGGMQASRGGLLVEVKTATMASPESARLGLAAAARGM